MNRSGVEKISGHSSELLPRLFPAGIPNLWCPALTHYDQHGVIDERRMGAHLRHLSQHIKGFLIPGSTSDGWELNDAETRRLVTIAIAQAEALGLKLLVGALRPKTPDVLQFIHETAGDLTRSTGVFCGYAVCAPHGRDLSQAEIGRALASVLATGHPIALYQLPQVTQNEISPELARDLAAQFDNFILFKDTSGADRVVTSGMDLRGVFTVRGAEGDYARWSKFTGAGYDGFLLSTANCFAGELSRMMAALAEGGIETANQISSRITQIINETFRAVSVVSAGNKYANANKAIDHFFAWGRGALAAPPPRLHAGVSIPSEAIGETGRILARFGMHPETGYLIPH